MLITWFALLSSYVFTEWTNGYYLNGDHWEKWDDSWLTWVDGNSCTECTSFMYLNSTSGLWQYWNVGWYYDETSQVWRDCQGIWKSACNYQQICYQWSSGKIYDTDLLKWVDAWTSPKILHNDTQYTINPIWRSPNIYINPQSTSMIELGTIKYPFKFSKSAFSEVLNQYSHSNNNILIYIKENTELKITKDMAYSKTLCPVPPKRQRSVQFW